MLWSQILHILLPGVSKPGPQAGLWGGEMGAASPRILSVTAVLGKALPQPLSMKHLSETILACAYFFIRSEWV